MNNNWVGWLMMRKGVGKRGMNETFRRCMEMNTLLSNLASGAR